MKLRKPSKKLLTALVALIVVCGLLTAIALLTKDSSDKSADTSKNAAKTADVEKGENPTEVLDSVDQYQGKEVALTGTITEISDGKYYVVGNNKEYSGAVLLDFSKSKLDPADYANAAPDSKSKQRVVLKGPFIIKGTFNQDTSETAMPTDQQEKEQKTVIAAPPTLIVKSISKIQ